MRELCNLDQYPAYDTVSHKMIIAEKSPPVIAWHLFHWRVTLSLHHLTDSVRRALDSYSNRGVESNRTTNQSQRMCAIQSPSVQKVFRVLGAPICLPEILSDECPNLLIRIRSPKESQLGMSYKRHHCLSDSTSQSSTIYSWLIQLIQLSFFNFIISSTLTYSE